MQKKKKGERNALFFFEEKPSWTLLCAIVVFDEIDECVRFAAVFIK